MKFLCIGDMHLGRHPSRLPVELLEQLPAGELGPAAAWRRTVDFALEAGVDAVLLAGDVVEEEDDFYEAYGDLHRGVERLAGAGVRVLAVAGNHDVEVLPRLARAVPGFRLLGEGGRWEIEDVAGRDGLGAHVLGWSFPRRRVATSPLLQDLPEPARQAGPLIGLLHCDRDASGSPYAPVRSSELESARTDAWLLGHVHKPDPLAPPRPIGYLGSLTGLDPGEPGARGPWLLECGGGGVGGAAPADLALEHLPLAPLRWEEVAVAVDGLEAAEDVHALVIAALDETHDRIAGERFGPRAVGCRLRFAGRSGLGPEIVRTLAAADPRRLLHRRGGIDFFVYDWRVAVAPAFHLEELARGADPPALVARKVLLLRGPPGAERQALLDGARERLKARSGVPALRASAAAPPPDDELAELLERAALRALGEMLSPRGRGP